MSYQGKIQSPNYEKEYVYLHQDTTYSGRGLGEIQMNEQDDRIAGSERSKQSYILHDSGLKRVNL